MEQYSTDMEQIPEDQYQKEHKIATVICGLTIIDFFDTTRNKFISVNSLIIWLPARKVSILLDMK